MNKYLIVLLSLLTIEGKGQEISAVQNWIFDADTLEKRKIEMGDFRIQGENQTWDLKGMKFVKKELRSKYWEQGDTVIGRELCNRMIYRQSPATWLRTR